jgi:hypothetical protein
VPKPFEKLFSAHENNLIGSALFYRVNTMMAIFIIAIFVHAALQACQKEELSV